MDYYLKHLEEITLNKKICGFKLKNGTQIYTMMYPKGKSESQQQLMLKELIYNVIIGTFDKLIYEGG